MERKKQQCFFLPRIRPDGTIFDYKQSSVPSGRILGSQFIIGVFVP